jgi:uncharacterized membrane protein
LTILWAYLIVFLLAATPFFEAIVIIPIAVAAGLPVIPVSLLAFLGNVATVLLVILMINQIQGWLTRRREAKGESSEPTMRQGRAKKLWNRYGLPGLAILGPLLVGSHLSAIMGMSFGGTKKQITIWMLASLSLWIIAVAIASHYGIGLLFENTGGDGFLGGFLEINK